MRALRTAEQLTDVEHEMIRQAALQPFRYGVLASLGRKLGVNYFTIYNLTIRHRRNARLVGLDEHDRHIIDFDEDENLLISLIPPCQDMIHSGETFAARMKRIYAQPMPGPNHGHEGDPIHSQAHPSAESA